MMITSRQMLFPRGGMLSRNVFSSMRPMVSTSAGSVGSTNEKTMSTEAIQPRSHPSFSTFNRTHSMNIVSSKQLSSSIGYRSIHMSSGVAQKARAQEGEDDEAQDLGTVAAREIAYERSDNKVPDYDGLQAEMDRLFPDWETDVCREQAYFRLQKTLNDEHIQVEVNACNPESVDRGATEHSNLDEEGGEDEGADTIDVLSLAITIEKTGQPHKVFCTAGISMETEPEMELVGVQLIPKDMSTSEVMQTRRYEGPEFSELDVSLQRSFHDYLLDRGFDEAFAEAVRDISDTKEEVEYISWLEGIRQFSNGPDVPSLGERE
eukprot:gb/GECG01009963.1/.p1 GENE.gb/GECG01009963.1/~~gb/GECG01009963.1/.p1  ORF type:complete len:320 (+),score=44.75 gb/GECG01009963.1/:1-960(+)